MRTIHTPSGDARIAVARPPVPAAANGLVVLGHGAGGGIDAPDLLAVSTALTAAGWVVARVEQPYRVRGQRAPERAPRLDAAWSAVVAALRSDQPHGRLVTGGRSSGARVACRTARVTAADAVVALAFPLRPPRRPDITRAAELDAGVPVLVVQGERDPFGGPDELPPGPTVVAVPGDHSLRQGADRAAAAVVDWLTAG
jgi:hypothetical protein